MDGALRQIGWQTVLKCECLASVTADADVVNFEKTTLDRRIIYLFQQVNDNNRRRWWEGSGPALLERFQSLLFQLRDDFFLHTFMIDPPEFVLLRDDDGSRIRNSDPQLVEDLP